MQTHLRKVGNSQGIIIPASFLDALKKPREGWFDNYKAEEMIKGDVWNDTLPDDITEDWEW